MSILIKARLLFCDHFRIRFRIVDASFAGYQVQRRRWWSPFWFRPGQNCFGDIRSAQKWIDERG